MIFGIDIEWNVQKNREYKMQLDSVWKDIPDATTYVRLRKAKNTIQEKYHASRNAQPES